MLFFPPELLSALLFTEHMEVVSPVLWCSSLGDMALFDLLTTNGNFLQQKRILPAVLFLILRQIFCVILTVQFCGLVEELYAVQQGIFRSPLPSPTLLLTIHSQLLSWAGSGDCQGHTLCCVSMSYWLMEKSKVYQSCHKGEGETWEVRRGQRSKKAGPAAEWEDSSLSKSVYQSALLCNDRNK